MYLEEVTIRVPVRQIITLPVHHLVTVHRLHHQAAAVHPAAEARVHQLESFKLLLLFEQNFPMSKTSHDRPLPFTDNHKLVI